MLRKGKPMSYGFSGSRIGASGSEVEREEGDPGAGHDRAYPKDRSKDPSLGKKRRRDAHNQRKPAAGPQHSTPRCLRACPEPTAMMRVGRQAKQ